MDNAFACSCFNSTQADLGPAGRAIHHHQQHCIIHPSHHATTTSTQTQTRRVWLGHTPAGCNGLQSRLVSGQKSFRLSRDFFLRRAIPSGKRSSLTASAHAQARGIWAVTGAPVNTDLACRNSARSAHAGLGIFTYGTDAALRAKGSRIITHFRPPTSECHAGGSRKLRSGTSFVPLSIPQSSQIRGFA